MNDNGTKESRKAQNWDLTPWIEAKTKDLIVGAALRNIPITVSAARNYAQGLIESRYRLWIETGSTRKTK